WALHEHADRNPDWKNAGAAIRHWRAAGHPQGRRRLQQSRAWRWRAFPSVGRGYAHFDGARTAAAVSGLSPTELVPELFARSSLECMAGEETRMFTESCPKTSGKG